MRFLAFCLLFLSFLAIWNITASLFIPAYKASIIAFRAQYFPQLQNTIPQQQSSWSTELQTGSVLIPNNEVDQLLSRINSTLNTLSGTQAPIQSPNVSIPQAPIIETPKAPQEIPISGILLARIMPEIYPKKIENSWIFDILIFRNLEYSSYRDARKKITIFAFNDSYKTIKTNLALVDKLYTTSENTTFFSGTMFLNPLKTDGMVRFVFELEWKAIGIEVPKSYYPRLKKMLTP